MRLDLNHVLVSKETALEVFGVFPVFPFRKPPNDAPLAILTVSKGFMDLCWWNGKDWQYSMSKKTNL